MSSLLKMFQNAMRLAFFGVVKIYWVMLGEAPARMQLFIPHIDIPTSATFPLISSIYTPKKLDFLWFRMGFQVIPALFMDIPTFFLVHLLVSRCSACVLNCLHNQKLYLLGLPRFRMIPCLPILSESLLVSLCLQFWQLCFISEYPSKSLANHCPSCSLQPFLLLCWLSTAGLSNTSGFWFVPNFLGQVDFNQLACNPQSLCKIWEKKTQKGATKTDKFWWVGD